MPKQAINARYQTPSRVQFDTNMTRLQAFFGALQSEVNQALPRVNSLLKAQGRKSVKIEDDEIERVVKLVVGGVKKNLDSILEWVPVMLVTFAEAYLQDVLAYLAASDSSLMSKSEQSAIYADVLLAKSIEELAASLRERWARGIINDGGPRKWSKTLPRIIGFSPDKYPDDLINKMELLWGVRHVVVHAAGFATRDFVQRHPDFGVSVRERIKLTSPQIIEWINAVIDFADITDEPIVARTNPVLGSRSR
jgi:hypothetical protein